MHVHYVPPHISIPTETHRGHAFLRCTFTALAAAQHPLSLGPELVLESRLQRSDNRRDPFPTVRSDDSVDLATINEKGISTTERNNETLFARVDNINLLRAGTTCHARREFFCPKWQHFLGIFIYLKLRKYTIGIPSTVYLYHNTL